MKFSKVSGAVHWSRGTIILSEGMSADDDHPLVLERPDLFGDNAPPPALRSGEGDRRRSGEPEPKVERATRAPGEKRGGTGRG